ncbi:MAG: ComEA family DNA-binding protein, partial [Solirubrobacterales bacterium]
NAEERLKQIEQRAADAERRAAFAERLAQLKIDESERERRLNEIMTGIDRAEERALEAEKRAKAAEVVAAAALEESEVIPAKAESIVAPAQSPQPRETPPTPAESAPEAPPAAPAPPVPPTPAPAAPVAEEAPAPPAAKSPLFGSGLPGGTGSSGSLNLNSATFEELREADLSVTQATRILAYRERFGGYHSVEDLEKVPGFPAELIESLRGRITV